jgi:hypothetical protein
MRPHNTFTQVPSFKDINGNLIEYRTSNKDLQNEERALRLGPSLEIMGDI